MHSAQLPRLRLLRDPDDLLLRVALPNHEPFILLSHYRRTLIATDTAFGGKVKSTYTMGHRSFGSIGQLMESLKIWHVAPLRMMGG